MLLLSSEETALVIRDFADTISFDDPVCLLPATDAEEKVRFRLT
jgi:hypothetical protein